MLVWAPSVLGVALCLWFGLPALIRRIATGQLAAACRASKAIVLTYDDGPNATTTPALADLLKRAGAKASFFVIGTRALAEPAIVARLVAEGHEIGNHTQNHINAWKTSPWSAIQDLSSGQQTLARLGIRTTIFRPPFGKSTLGTLIASLSLKIAFWTVDTRDSWNRRPIADVIAEIEAKGGGVVLMHDVEQPRRGPSPASHPSYLLEVTEALIEYAEAGSYRLLRFGDLMDSTSRTGPEA